MGNGKKLFSDFPCRQQVSLGNFSGALSKPRCKPGTFQVSGKSLPRNLCMEMSESDCSPQKTNKA